MLKKLMIVSLMSLYLIGCSQEPSRQISCGTLIEYYIATQKLASEEVDSLNDMGEAPTVIKLIEDYSKTRDSIRKCKEIK